MKIIIYDIDNELIKICKEKFKDIKIECLCTKVSELKADYIVTAGNSYGVMTGGLDLAVREHFGQKVQDNIQDYIMMERNGVLEVGELIVVSLTENKNGAKHLVYAPTMKKPKTIYKEDVYLVACRIFRYIKLLEEDHYVRENDSFAICGLGTVTGGVLDKDFAEMMYRAYNDIYLGDEN